jgi:hypothetical protein
VVQRGQQLRLTLEPRNAIAIAGKGRRQELQGDVSLQARVAGAVDLAHAAFAKRFDDLAVPESRPRRQ